MMQPSGPFQDQYTNIYNPQNPQTKQSAYINPDGRLAYQFDGTPPTLMQMPNVDYPGKPSVSTPNPGGGNPPPQNANWWEDTAWFKSLKPKIQQIVAQGLAGSTPTTPPATGPKTQTGFGDNDPGIKKTGGASSTGNQKLPPSFVGGDGPTHFNPRERLEDTTIRSNVAVQPSAQVAAQMAAGIMTGPATFGIEQAAKQIARSQFDDKEQAENLLGKDPWNKETYGGYLSTTDLDAITEKALKTQNPAATFNKELAAAREKAMNATKAKVESASSKAAAHNATGGPSNSGGGGGYKGGGATGEGPNQGGAGGGPKGGQQMGGGKRAY